MISDEEMVRRYLKGREIGFLYGMAIEAETAQRIARVLEIPVLRVRLALRNLRREHQVEVDKQRGWKLRRIER